MVSGPGLTPTVGFTAVTPKRGSFHSNVLLSPSVHGSGSGQEGGGCQGLKSGGSFCEASERAREREREVVISTSKLGWLTHKHAAVCVANDWLEGRPKRDGETETVTGARDMK